jgi:protein O-GlcNAc transferase
MEELDRYDEALASYERALAAEPDHVDALCLRGGCLRSLNRMEDAQASYQRVLALTPDHAEARFAACMAELPVLYADEAEIGRCRAAYAERLEALCNDVDSGRVPGLAKGVGSSQPFFLAYQGLNDRALQARYGALVCRVMAERYPSPALPEPPANDEPVRVGFVSGYFRAHSVWKMIGSASASSAITPAASATSLPTKQARCAIGSCGVRCRSKAGARRSPKTDRTS